MILISIKDLLKDAMTTNVNIDYCSLPTRLHLEVY